MQGVYFTRDTSKAVTTANISDSIYFGVLRGGKSVPSLMTLMNSIYVPSMLNDPSFPDAVRRDLTGQLHKFMANLVETRYHVEGRTVLYIPRQVCVGRVGQVAAQQHQGWRWNSAAATGQQHDLITARSLFFFIISVIMAC